jgi:hypothetical protein
VLAFNLRYARWGVTSRQRKEGVNIMVNTNSFSGVGVAGMSWPLHVAGTPAAAAHVAGTPAAAAHPVAAYAATGAQAIMPRERRTTAATVASVNRGTT